MATKIATMRTLSPHPNMLLLHDVFEDEEGFHVVLEFCKGAALLEQISNRVRSGVAVAVWAHLLALGLADSMPLAGRARQRSAASAMYMLSPLGLGVGAMLQMMKWHAVM